MLTIGDLYLTLSDQYEGLCNLWTQLFRHLKKEIVTYFETLKMLVFKLLFINFNAYLKTYVTINAFC